PAWANVMAKEPVRGVGSRGEPAQGDDAGVGGGVSDGIEMPRRRPECQYARRVEDDAVLLVIQEMPNGRAIREEGGAKVLLNRLVPAFVGTFVQGAVAKAATA